MSTFTTTSTVLPDTSHQHQQQSTHDKKKCTSASCCSPSRLWKSIQQFLSQQDKEGLLKLCQDEEKKPHVLRVLLTSRYHNDPSRYGASNKHLVLNLSDKMVGASIDNTALNLSNSIKRRKLVYEKFGKPLTDLNALQLAIIYRNEDIILSLLDLMYQNATTKEFHSFLHHQCGKQISSLHLAGFLALPKVVEKLLSFGMDPQLKNGRMKTPLDCTDHLDCRQLLEMALDALNPPPATLNVMIMESETESEVDTTPSTPTTAADEMNLIDLDVNENEIIIMTDQLIINNVATEKRKDELVSLNNNDQQLKLSTLITAAETFDLDLTDTWMMDVLDDHHYHQTTVKKSFGFDLDLTDTWMMDVLNDHHQSMINKPNHHQSMVNKPSSFDWLTATAFNDTWIMNTSNNDQVLSSSPMGVATTTTKAPDLDWMTLNGTWLMHLKDDDGSSSTPFTTLNCTWLMKLKNDGGSTYSSSSLTSLNGTWLMHLKDDGSSTYSSSSPTIHLNDTWLMDVWKENDSNHYHHHQLDPSDSKQQHQQSLPDLQFFNHRMKKDDDVVLATPPLSPVQDDDDYDDDNESMNLDELPELELDLGNDSSPHLLDDHGDTHLVPLLFNVNDLKSSGISFNYQQEKEKRNYENGDTFMLNHLNGDTNHSHLVFPPPSKLNVHSNSSPPLTSSLNHHPSPTSANATAAFDDDHGSSTRSSLNHHHHDLLMKNHDSSGNHHHPLVDKSPPSSSLHVSVNDPLNDASISYGGGGTTIHLNHDPPNLNHHQKLQDHDPPNNLNHQHQEVKQDHRTVHFDPKVVLMETCIRGDLKELMDTLQDLLQQHDSSSSLSWLFNHHGNSGVHDRTLLQLALLNGHESIIHYLVNHVKVNVNQVDADGWTALHYAAALGQWKIAEYLASLHLTDLFAQTDDGFLYEDCTRSRLDRIRCQWLLDRAMMNHSLSTTHHKHSTLASPLISPTTSPLMCG